MEGNNKGAYRDSTFCLLPSESVFHTILFLLFIPPFLPPSSSLPLLLACGGDVEMSERLEFSWDPRDSHAKGNGNLN
jgi:hypothetical protein